MNLARFVTVLLLTALFASGLAADDTVTVTGTKPAPTASVTLMTDVATPAEFGTTYALGQLNNSTYTYGSNFLVKVTYANVTTSVALAFSGSQANYELAYRHNQPGGSVTADVALGTVGTVSTTGAATDTYVSGTTTTAFDGFDTAANATRFALGAKSTTAATSDLSTTVTITVTVQ